MRFIRRLIVLATAGAMAGGLGGGLVPVHSAMAQSAADKAMARKLATEGIELFKAGKFAESLERLSRAQQLYDAPVHLIYMARCHARLGQFVESAEAYRRLVRTQLPDDAPGVFKEAVADAKQELPDVEPKIANLRISVEPADIAGLEVKVDDVALSSAALGADRPVNPGSRRVTASAPGHKPSEQTIELKPGEKKKVTLVLEADGSAPAGGTGGAGGSAGGGEGGSTGGAGAESATQGNLGFIVGLRLGAAIPAGQLAQGYAMKNYFGPGGGVELRGGVRVFKRYSAILMAGGESYQPGAELEAGPPESVVQVTPEGLNAGVGLMYAPPPGTLGIIAEIDLLPLHRFTAKREVNLAPPDKDCTQTLKAVGTAVRLSGGIQVPLTPWLQLSPYAGVAFAQITDFSVDGSCGAEAWADKSNTPWHPGSDAEGQRAGHFVVSLGVGGDILFGSDKPSK